MPPKNQASKKTVEKQKQKIVEDKTFGLKNKKGAKQQKFVEQVQKSVYQGNKSNKEIDKSKAQVENKKEQKKKELEELNSIFKPVVELQKIGKGVDPKSVLCVFFKQGQCGKGDKCKFSHDLNVVRKTEKRNIYESIDEQEREKDDMDNWDQNKLEDVVQRRHGVTNNRLPPTTIICKFFVDAVESNKYGWFWTCPSGEKCHYRHALPADFVLKRDKKKMEEQKEDQISLEDLIEKERAALGDNLTRITWTSFSDWKRRKRADRVAKESADVASREKAFRQGKQVGISGRELFEFNPDFVKENQDLNDDYLEGGAVVGDEVNVREDDEYAGPVREINISDYYCPECPNDENNNDKKKNGDGDQKQLNNEVTVIDEDLFKTEDLEGLDDELENLGVD